MNRCHRGALAGAQDCPRLRNGVWPGETGHGGGPGLGRGAPWLEGVGGAPWVWRLQWERGGWEPQPALPRGGGNAGQRALWGGPAGDAGPCLGRRTHLQQGWGLEALGTVWVETRFGFPAFSHGSLWGAGLLEEMTVCSGKRVPACPEGRNAAGLCGSSKASRDRNQAAPGLTSIWRGHTPPPLPPGRRRPCLSARASRVRAVHLPSRAPPRPAVSPHRHLHVRGSLSLLTLGLRPPPKTSRNPATGSSEVLGERLLKARMFSLWAFWARGGFSRGSRSPGKQA